MHLPAFDSVYSICELILFGILGLAEPHTSLNGKSRKLHHSLAPIAGLENLDKFKKALTKKVGLFEEEENCQICERVCVFVGWC